MPPTFEKGGGGGKNESYIHAFMYMILTNKYEHIQRNYNTFYVQNFGTQTNVCPFPLNFKRGRAPLVLCHCNPLHLGRLVGKGLWLPCNGHTNRRNLILCVIAGSFLVLPPPLLHFSPKGFLAWSTICGPVSLIICPPPSAYIINEPK